MSTEHPVLDLRQYRPIAIIAIDLVKHSLKGKEPAQRARQILERTFATHVKSLGLADTLFNFTGDGYVCALLGDDSSRLIDYVNATFPELAHQLGRVQQKYRAGVDFGFAHLSANTLTGSLEHFEQPGIFASRLEHAAADNEILCTETVKTIFYPLNPDVFSANPRVVQCKDRELTCYEITPIDYDNVQQALRLVISPPRARALSRKARGHLLMVDDDDTILEGVSEVLRPLFASITIASNAADAIAALSRKNFTVALLDLRLSGPFAYDGLAVATHIMRHYPTTAVVMLTGFFSLAAAQHFYDLGGHLFLSKPISMSDLTYQLDQAVLGHTPAVLRSHARLFCDDVGSLLAAIADVAGEFALLRTNEATDAATKLLRHKAAQLTQDFVAGVRPGADLLHLSQALAVRLRSLNRLADAVHRASTALAYVSTLASDYSRMHPAVSIRVTGDARSLANTGVSDLPLYTLAIIELIDNAVAAVVPAGAIEITISALHAAGVLYTRVRDNGPGLPSAMEGRIFDGSYSSKGAGHGLGLSLIHDAIRHIRGSIDYTFDHGACFTITAPLR